jgi:AcrR family transcriptional regulator
MTTATRTRKEAEAGRISRPRADALRNRERIVTAAREAFVEHGPDVPLDEIARRANIGNATLYRHFPDRSVLLVEVVLSVTAGTADEAERAAREEPDAFAALSRFVHTAADLRVGAMCALLSGHVDMACEQLSAERERVQAAVQALIVRARDEGRLRPDVGYIDLMVVLSQLTRPLPGTDCIAMDRYTHRFLQLFLDGLEVPVRSALPGRPATLEDLRRTTR